MQKIHVIGHKGCYTRHLHPIRVFWKELMDIGLDVKYFSSLQIPYINECDVLVFFEFSYRDILPITNKDRNASIDYLNLFFEKFSHVIWFDDHDSSGMLRTYIFPQIDTYAKAQLLKDKKYYQEEHLTGVLHRDFAHEQYQVADAKIFKGVISSEDVCKIRPSWNLALNNWVYNNSYLPIFNELVQRNRRDYNFNYTIPNLSKRNPMIPYRVNLWNNIPTVSWWRKHTGEQLEKFTRLNKKIHMSPPGKLGKRKYLAEMKNTIVTLSPFGIGEICYRDFECFINGSLLFKPSMNHIQTWPNLYIDGETYVSHEWDFSDFNEKLLSILTNPHRYEQVAWEGQNRFRKALSDGPAFARYFKSMID